MRRVYVIWALRRAFSPFMVKIYLGAAFLWEIGSHVWVSRVFSNSPEFVRIGESFSFFVHAFTGAQFMVQLLVVALLVIGGLLFKDLIRQISAGSFVYLGREQ